MALEQTKTFKGIEGNYWRILDINKNFNNGKIVHFTIGLYKDESIRNENSKAALYKENRFIEIDNLNEDIRKQIYTKLKSFNPSNQLFNLTDFREAQSV